MTGRGWPLRPGWLEAIPYATPSEAPGRAWEKHLLIFAPKGKPFPQARFQRGKFLNKTRLL